MQACTLRGYGQALVRSIIGPGFVPDGKLMAASHRLACALRLCAQRVLPLLALWVATSAAWCAEARSGFAIEDDSPYLLWRAQLALVDSATPPGDDAPWQPVQLPDSWRDSQRWQHSQTGWYRFSIAGPAPAQATSVYLWRFSMNAAVWFNGQYVGDGGSFDEPVARNWNRPLIFRLPSAMWHDGANTLMVRLRTYPGFGHLMPVGLGPSELLRADHEQRSFSQITLSQVAAGITLLALLTGAVLWLVDRHDAALPYFMGFCLAWFIYGANTFVRDIPVPASTWWWAVHSSVDFCFWLVVCLFHRLLGERRPRIEGALLAWAVLCSVLYAVWGLATLARYNPLLHGLSALAGLYLGGWLSVQLVRRRDVQTLLFTLIFAALFIASLHDQLLNALLLPDLWRSRYYLLHLVMPLLFLGLITLLALRTSHSVRAVRSANEGLEMRVRAASRDVAEAYAREGQLRDERSAAQERERIYGELHDNLGARLLSLVYGARDEHEASLAREALAEMRALIGRSQQSAGRLADLATDWQLECELRCEDAGLQLGWQVQGDAMLGARQRFQLERVLRELVSNALEHARAHRIDVALLAGGDTLQLRVCDDGCGVADFERIDGRGIAGIRSRVADLGGVVQWKPHASGGTCCTLWFALAQPARSTA